MNKIMEMDQNFRFAVITGETVQRVIKADFNRIISVVEQAYRSHHQGNSVNPSSHFLSFPDKPNARIIALPASLRNGFDVSGIKWIASYPENIQHGIPRASAVLILNDRNTGYPYACIESSLISAARTASSAVLNAYWLNGQKKAAKHIGFFGTGIIARNTLDFFLGTGWHFEQIHIFDQVPQYAASFAAHATAVGYQDTVMCTSGDTLIRACDLIVFATTAPRPHVLEPSLFAHNPTVLHISLRDLAPAIILGADNLVDDIDHCLTANTSPHLAEQQVGHRNFITGTIGDLLHSSVTLSGNRPVILSPFGMGILDIAVGKYVYDEAVAQNDLIAIDDFFYERKRW
jgi:ornithine cyclodeaminase